VDPILDQHMPRHEALCRIVTRERQGLRPKEPENPMDLDLGNYSVRKKLKRQRKKNSLKKEMLSDFQKACIEIIIPVKRMKIFDSNTHGRMARCGHGLCKVSPGPAMP
jgi:hypothetical protein